MIIAELAFRLDIHFYKYMSVLQACVLVHHMPLWCQSRPEEGLWSPGIGVADSCELQSGYCKSNTGLLEKQPLFLTSDASFQPLFWFFKISNKSSKGLFLQSEKKH